MFYDRRMKNTNIKCSNYVKIETEKNAFKLSYCPVKCVVGVIVVMLICTFLIGRTTRFSQKTKGVVKSISSLISVLTKCVFTALLILRLCRAELTTSYELASLGMSLNHVLEPSSKNGVCVSDMKILPVLGCPSPHPFGPANLR